MTDTEGTEARRSDGEETQFIQPIRDYGRAETKPLDLPRATIGGYRADAVERRVAELERRRTLDQATRRKQGIDQEADRRIGESREQAQKLLSDANTEADKILKAAEAKAARLDAETKTRVADADRREREAARTVDQARRLLADAAARLARPVPELPATNPRE